jgi:multisubunit Na+/H+ antiporter MnhE subunit
MSRFLLTVALLTLVYALALASFEPLDLATGAILASILLAASRTFILGPDAVPIPGMPGRLVAFFRFAFAVLGEIITGTITVALITLRLRPRPNSGIVAVPILDRTPLGLAVWAIACSLPPGSYFVDVNDQRQVVLIHLLDAEHPDDYCRKCEEFYRRYQSRVFP